MTVKKDKEGSTSEEYGAASSVTGESWPASGEVQVEQYGQKLNYIRNIRIQGNYKIQTDGKSRLHYILEDGTDIEERDGFVYMWQQISFQTIGSYPSNHIVSLP